MPAFLTRQQLHNAVHRDALPALERLATNSQLRDRALSRFNNDDPPPYASSSESENDEDALRFHPAMPRPSSATVLEKYKAVLDLPLNEEEESRTIMRNLVLYSPGCRYRSEAKAEWNRLSNLLSDCYYSNPNLFAYLKIPEYRQRIDTVIRHLIRKRWEKLGVWNSDWGIPGRGFKQPNDNPEAWTWSWDRDSDEDKTKPDLHTVRDHAVQPVRRAQELRRNLSRGDHAPVPPRSRLNAGSSPSQAQSFITSRPWFIIHVEEEEEYQRSGRLSNEEDANYGLDISYSQIVYDRWKERGDHTDENLVPGWKWRHESPSPEPEDLTPLTTMEMDFSPSEVDALENIRPPTPSTPPGALPSPKWDDGLFARMYLESLAREQKVAEEKDLRIRDTTAPSLRSRPQARPQRRRKDTNTDPAPTLRRSARVAAQNSSKPNPAPTLRRSLRIATKGFDGQAPDSAQTTRRIIRKRREALGVAPLGVAKTQEKRSYPTKKKTTNRRQKLGK